MSTLQSKQIISKLLILFLILVSFYLFVFHASKTYLLDYELYLEAGTRFKNGINIYFSPYKKVTETGQVFTLYYYYPPFLAWIFSWFVDFPSLKIAWCFLSFLCVISSAFLTAMRFKILPEKFSNLALHLFLFICFEPIYSGIREGQVDAIILLLITLCFVFVELTSLAACAICLAAWIKISPAFLAFAFYKQKRFLLVFLVSSLFILILSLLGPLNIKSYLDFLQTFQVLNSGNLVTNYAYDFAFERVFLNFFSLGNLPIYKYALRIVVFGIFLYCLRFSSQRSHSQHQRLSLSLALCFMFLLLPTLWFHHLAWLLLVLLYLASSLASDLKQKKLVQYLGLYFLISQSFLIHTQARLYGLDQYSKLIPSLAVITLIILILSEKKGASKLVNPVV